MAEHFLPKQPETLFVARFSGRQGLAGVLPELSAAERGAEAIGGQSPLRQRQFGG
jgi:hypothetical protein